MSLKVNFDYIPEHCMVDFEENALRVKSIDKMIQLKTGKGNDFLGWVDYPVNYNKEEVERIIAKAESFKKNYEILVVCGIGGSYLGARAAIEALNGLLPRNKKGMEVLYLGNTLDPNYTHDILEYIKDKKFAVCVISKSGTTTETSVSFRILKEMLETKIGKEGAKDAIVAVTDKENGALRKLANDEGYETFELPRDIGGRFSVITPVGLFPIACAGININELIDGLKQAREDFSSNDIFQNQCYQYALVRNYLHNIGYKIEMFSSYEMRFRMLAEWWKQLFDESEGKDGKAVFTTAATFTTDLHSLGQFIQEGTKVLYETILHIEEPEYDVEVPFDKDDLDGLNYLAGKKLSYINKKAYEGTLEAHSETGGVPNITITLDKMNTFNLGYLFYFFMKACAMSAYLLGVNPFNQPGVEVYKKNMFHLLGKPGF